MASVREQEAPDPRKFFVHEMAGHIRPEGRPAAQAVVRPSMKWQSRLTAKRTKLGMGLDTKPWTNRAEEYPDRWRANPELAGVPRSSRQEEILECSYAAFIKKGGDPCAPTHFVNIGSSIDWGSLVRTTVPCIQTQSACYSFRMDCALQLQHYVSSLGHPVDGISLRGVDERKYRHSLGESVHLPSMGLLLLAVCSIQDAPWKRPASKREAS